MQPLNHPGLWLAGWLLAMAAALLVCLLPMPPIAPGVDHFDKVTHAIGFALLAINATMLFKRGRPLIGAGLGLLAFGGLIELLQLLVPWRSAESLDLLADAAGVAAGLSLAPTPIAGLLRWIDARLPRRATRRA